jgi:hypothetical protein
MDDSRSDVIVVGSGPSGAQAAAAIVHAGRSATMLDIGRHDETLASIIPEKSFSEIRKSDREQHRYLLGDQFEGIDFGSVGAGPQITPPRQYILHHSESLAPVVSSDFEALQGLALGGLGAAWGAVSFPFTDAELAQCGLSADETRPHYEETAREVGISGCGDDDLTALRGPLHNLQPPLEVDSNAQAILSAYLRKKLKINHAGTYLGQSLMAILTEPLGARRPQPYFDMDFWSNAGGSVYRPALTVQQLKSHSKFQYHRAFVETFKEGSDGRVTVVARSIETNQVQQFSARSLILASGAFGTARIVLRSFNQFDVRLPLTCNSHTYIPCLLPRQLGKLNSRRRHSLAQVSMIYDPIGDRRHLVQAQFYSYGSLLLYRLLKESPMALKESLRLVRAIAPCFGIWVIQHEDRQSSNKFLELCRGAEGPDRVKVTFKIDPKEQRRQRKCETRMAWQIWRLGCLPLRYVRPIHGSSAHYGSTLSFSEGPTQQLSTESSGRLRSTRSVYIADGSSLRYLPAKGLTFTLMANARRVASNVLRAID